MNNEELSLEDLCQASCKVVREVGDFIKKELGKVSDEKVELKSLNSLVSYVDKNAEMMLVENLGKLLHGSTFLTEEETVVQQKSDKLWIIDPLDGTTNFIHQLPIFSISVALYDESEGKLGIIYDIMQDKMYYAWKNGGAYCNGNPIKVNATQKLPDSLLVTGFPYYDYGRLDAYMELLKYFTRNTRGIRRLGSAAIDLAYIARGVFEAFYEYSLSPWDVAAGILIVKEAGGKVSGFDSNDDPLYGRTILASNGHVHEEILGVINHFFMDSK